MQDEVIIDIENPKDNDLISRQAVLEIIDKWYENNSQLLLNDCIEDLIVYVTYMPPVRPQEPKWIPVSERLPEEETAVLISCEDLYLHRLNPCIGWRNGQYWNTFTANGYKQILYPTAWMPLPEPYKTESEDKE